ncbi:MAG: disulfide reductase, partial [candidate division WOR-3 bacterium]
MAKIGVFVCHCGVNISAKVDVTKVVEALQSLPEVGFAKEYKFMCSSPGQGLIRDAIKEHNINRVVVAACSPRMHLPTFQKALLSE